MVVQHNSPRREVDPPPAAPVNEPNLTLEQLAQRLVLYRWDFTTQKQRTIWGLAAVKVTLVILFVFLIEWLA